MSNFRLANSVNIHDGVRLKKFAIELMIGHSFIKNFLSYDGVIISYQ